MSGRNWRSSSRRRRFLSSFCCRSALPSFRPVLSLRSRFSWSRISSSWEISSASFAGETLAAASRLDLSIVSRMYLANTVASCNSPEILRMVSCSCFLSASLSACSRWKRTCASSIWSPMPLIFVSRSRSSRRASSSCARSCAMVASSCFTRSPASASVASSCRSSTLILFLYCSTESFAVSSCLPKDSLSLDRSLTFWSTASCSFRF
mmetsp:Transcript_20970/g.65571  ORF Transcript_20970/g.65571 Transcript_20970/m.65571 type:complete len:208 (+) Transcript_20970:311-934(+)